MKKLKYTLPTLHVYFIPVLFFNNNFNSYFNSTNSKGFYEISADVLKI